MDLMAQMNGRDWLDLMARLPLGSKVDLIALLQLLLIENVILSVI